MGTLFASTLRALVREKSLFIWSLAFPILMATIFMFMFANLDGAMEFDPVPTGVVADEAWDTSPFSAVAEALGERGDDQLLDVCRFADGEAAASALVDGEVMGVFSVDEDGEGGGSRCCPWRRGCRSARRQIWMLSIAASWNRWWAPTCATPT